MENGTKERDKAVVSTNVAGAWAARQQMASSKSEVEEPPLRVGIIGMGKMGRIRADVVRSRADMKLTAISDVDPDLATEFPGLPFYGDYHQLIDRDLDVIFVCTYNDIAPRIVEEALDRGQHVFCEKPPGRCVEDVEKIIEAETRNPHLKLQFGFNHRYHYAVVEAKALVDSGRFGPILWMRGVYGKCGGSTFENSWRNDQNIAGGGILLDQGIHMLDLFRYMAGDFPHAKSLVTTSFWNIPVEDNAFAILSNDRGQVAMIHSSATHWKHRFSLEICLQDGYINLNGILSSTRSYGDESITSARRQFEDESFALGKPREETVFFDRDDSWHLETAEFARAIRENRPVTSGNSADALKVMRMIENIYQKGHRSV